MSALDGLPNSQDVMVPCDWCRRQEVSHEKPPAYLWLSTNGLLLAGGESRNWRICADCLGDLTKLVRARAAGV